MPCFGVDESNTGAEVTEGNFANKARTERGQAEEGPEDGGGLRELLTAEEDGLADGDGLEEGGGEDPEGLDGGRCKPQRPPTN